MFLLKNHISKSLLLFCLVLLIAACTQEKPISWDGPELTEPRDQLTIEQLQQNRFLPLMDMSYFAQPDGAEEAVHNFSGSISFEDTRLIFPKERASYEGENTFPAFSVDFITHEGDLIPIQKQPIVTRQDSNSYWDVIVGAGAVWQEKNDRDWSRASFPLSLIDRYMGQVRNCVATFVYQSNMISNVYVQCSQESADYNDNSGGDIRVMLRDVAYRPLIYPNTEAVITQHAEHESERLPIVPLSSIDTDGQIAAYFSKSLLTNASTSLGMVLVDGTLYLHPPQTRHGTYPYPHEMRHGVWSVSKSMTGALALFIWKSVTMKNCSMP